MELRPADLGEAYQSTIVLKRTRGKSNIPANEKRTRVNPWVRRSVGSLNLPTTVAQETLPSVSEHTRSFPIIATVMCCSLIGGTLNMHAPVDAHLAIVGVPVALTVVGNLLLRREAVRDLYKRPIRESEIAYLRPTAVKEMPENWFQTRVPTFLRDMLPPRPEVKSPATLESDYFDLVASILRLPEPESSVRDELRDTLHQIGDAVAAIRRSEIEEERTDARDLIGDAEILAARARREPDQVIAGSLLRQARAKVAQAKVVDGNVMLRRRTRALDAELRAQIAATRATLRNLSSQGTMSLESNGAFRTIANSVRTLATEATSVNAARDELAAALRGEDTLESTTAQPKPQTTLPAQHIVVASPAHEVEKPVTLRNRRGG